MLNQSWIPKINLSYNTLSILYIIGFNLLKYCYEFYIYVHGSQPLRWPPMISPTFKQPVQYSLNVAISFLRLPFRSCGFHLACSLLLGSLVLRKASFHVITSPLGDAPEQRNWGLLPVATWMSLASDSPALVKTSDDFDLRWWTDCNLLREPYPEQSS